MIDRHQAALENLPGVRDGRALQCSSPPEGREIFALFVMEIGEGQPDLHSARLALRPPFLMGPVAVPFG